MGHRKYRSLAYMQRLGLLQGCRVTPAEFVQAGQAPCEACIRAKTHRASHTIEATKTTILLHRLIVDMKDSMSVTDCGCKYLIRVAEEASGNQHVGPLLVKSDPAAFVISTIVLWDKQVQAPGFHVVQGIRMDNGTELMGSLLTY